VPACVTIHVMKGNGDLEVVIEFGPWAADVVRGRQWHSSQQVTDLPDGGSRMTMRLSGLEEVERWVVSWGANATVVRTKDTPSAKRLLRTPLGIWYTGRAESSS